MPDNNAVNPFEKLQSKSLIGDVNLVLSKLDPREADIIRLTLWIRRQRPTDSRRGRRKIGVTRERIRQLQEQALRQLRKNMATFEKQRTAEEIKRG